jgi:pimeloyl-ACP methyl ester carboxylesterase
MINYQNREQMLFNEFTQHNIVVNGIQLHYRKGGKGEPLLLLHGWPQHSLMWHTVAPYLADYFEVITPDLRGAGGSSIPVAGYDKKTMAKDILGLMDHLGYSRVYLAGYDLGSGVAYSLAAQHPHRVKKLAVMEFGLPGYGYESQLTPTPDWHAGSNWHLSLFTLPQVAEWIFKGRERDLLDWFFWHLSHHQEAVSPEHFEEYLRQMSKPGALRAGIEYYAAVWTDREDNLKLGARKLEMPLLAIGGESSAGYYVGKLFEPVATTVTSVVIPGAGHWLGDENPLFLAEQLHQFFTK